MRIWDASSAALHQIGKFSTSSCFLSDDMDIPPDDEDAEDDDEWPPFRKVKNSKLKVVKKNGKKKK